ncbi:MAG TPA: hypothetical protein PLR06_06775 [Cyclobacteriaceae bacterium]|nr:hypothetical protein [Cyclobacteriaceae bacterium]
MTQPDQPVIPPQPTTPDPAPVKSSRPKATLSISGIFNKNGSSEKIQETVVEEKLPKETIQISRLKEVWAEYAEQRKNQAAEYQILLREFEFNHPIINVTLTNPVEETLIENFRRDFVQFLRDQLKNSDLTIHTVLKEATANKVIYTSKEKFDHLAEKNPYLKELKDRLGLDWDF